jgi:hypothetical protein
MRNICFQQMLKRLFIVKTCQQRFKHLQPGTIYLDLQNSRGHGQEAADAIHKDLKKAWREHRA